MHLYRVVVADSRTKRDGRVIEEIGKYHPIEQPSLIEIDSERAQYWLSVGAQPTEQVAALLKLTGDLQKAQGESAESQVKPVEAKEEFVADEAKKPVLKPKEDKPAAAPAEEASPAPAEDASEAPAEEAASEEA